MKNLCILKRIAVVTSIALVLTLGGMPEAQAQRGGIAKFKEVLQHHPWLAKSAAGLAMFVLSVQLGTGSVLAQQGDVPQPVAQVAQAQMASPIPLYEAVRHYDYATLKAVLEAGQVDVNARDEQGNTALHIVAIEELHDFRSDSLLHLLLQHGANANLINNAGRTALSHNEMQDILEWGEFLSDIERARQRVADYLSDPANNITLLTEPPKRYIELGDLLHLTPSPYGYAQGLSKTLSRAAILVNDKEAFLSLLEAEGEIKQKVIIEEGKHLLILATRYGNTAVVEALLDNWVNPSVAIFDAAYIHRQGGNPQLAGVTVGRFLGGREANRLFKAKRYNERGNDLHRGGGTIIIDNNDPDHEVLNMLIARGANVNAIHPQGHTPLHLAAEAGDPRAVEILLKNGADPNAVDRFGLTPLHYAASRSAWVNFEITALLLAGGVDANLLRPDKLDYLADGRPNVYAAEQFRKHRDGEGWKGGDTPIRKGMPVAASVALINKQEAMVLRMDKQEAMTFLIMELKAKNYTDMRPMTREDWLVEMEHKAQEADRDAKRWAKISSETIQKIVAGDMAIEQLLNSEILQQVVAELRQQGLEELKNKQ